LPTVSLGVASLAQNAAAALLKQKADKAIKASFGSSLNYGISCGLDWEYLLRELDGILFVNDGWQGYSLFSFVLFYLFDLIGDGLRPCFRSHL
jgi:hypothetical protein